MFSVNQRFGQLPGLHHSDVALDFKTNALSMNGP